MTSPSAARQLPDLEWTERDDDAVRHLRALAADAVQRVGNGHPGTAMALAPVAYLLFQKVMRHDPRDPSWLGRDRFVLSPGHSSLTLYSQLFLSDYGLSMADLESFRTWGSRTPGHPEHGHTAGVETTTGPLGQGLATAVGMALAEKMLGAQYNREGHDVVDHHTYVFLGDGCIMEGISHEAASLAGTLGLGKLICLYDDNGISIDGHVEGWFTDDTPKRFEAYGWKVIPNVNGHDFAALDAAIAEAKTSTDKPVMICCKTVIGMGSPNKAGGHDCHGSPLGDAEIAATRANIGWSHGPFEIPADVYAGWDAKAKGAASEGAWNERFAAYRAAHPQLAAEFRTAGGVPGLLFDQVIPDTGADATALPWADCQALGLDPTRGVPARIGGVGGTAAATLVFPAWVVLDGREYRCRLQADFEEAERILGRDVLNRVDVLFRGPAREVVVNP